MRKRCEVQTTIFDILPDHSLGLKYQAISQILEQHPRILTWVASDLGVGQVNPTGRQGISAESILRAAIIKQMHQFSYEELAIHVIDSNTFNAFCRFGGQEPCKSTLQSGISRITAATWEKINRAILVTADAEGVENGRVVRTDSTPIESDIHKPMDSELLWDIVRVLARSMKCARKSFPGLAFCDRTRACKKRLLKLRFASRKVDKKQMYRDMLRYATETIGYVEQAIDQINSPELEWTGWIFEARRFVQLAKQVVSQTKRRVFEGEKVPAAEKVFSLFEDHTDIVVKGRQDITYGHKINLTTGRSGMVLDLVVEDGNPADVDRAVVMIKRQIEIYGQVPRQCAFDGAYACKKNLDDIKALGVKDAVFQKKRGLKIGEMAKSPWVYRKLRNFRAGVESIISCLKRSYGWTRCTWKGLKHFKAYTWASAVTFNLMTLGQKIMEAQAAA